MNRWELQAIQQDGEKGGVLVDENAMMQVMERREPYLSMRMR
jgi:hypothetical protein